MTDDRQRLASDSESAAVTTNAADILLVEANHGDVRLLRETLREAAITNPLHVVSDGDEAVDFVRQRGDHADSPRPDLVLLNLNLPGSKSETVLAELARDPDLAAVPVIALTCSTGEAELARSNGVDVDAFIQKPADFDQFHDEFVDLVRSFETLGLTLVRAVPTAEE